MTSKLASLTIALALFAATGGSASAADWNNGAGSIKDMGGAAAVPVPAPVPIPVYKAQWYFRADFGIGMGDDPGFSETGMLYGMTDSPGVTGPEPFGNLPAWFNGEQETFLTWGGGVGYRWSERFRTDATIEARSSAHARIEGEEHYIKHEFDCCGGYGPILDPVTGDPMTQVNIYTSDRTSMKGGVMMFNAYYDFANFRGFTPYIGAGLGVSFNVLKRTHETTETECSLQTTPACDSEGVTNAYSASRTTRTMTLAAAAMAGFSYDVDEITTLDFNYRFMHIGGTHADLDIDNGTQVMRSRVMIGDINEHQLRAGVRFNIH